MKRKEIKHIIISSLIVCSLSLLIYIALASGYVRFEGSIRTRPFLATTTQSAASVTSFINVSPWNFSPK